MKTQKDTITNAANADRLPDFCFILSIAAAAAAVSKVARRECCNWSITVAAVSCRRSTNSVAPRAAVVSGFAGMKL